MKPENTDREMHVLATLPIVIKWMEMNKELTDDDLRNLKKLYPEQYKFALDVSFDELIAMNSRYRDSKVYGKMIETLLSDEGKRWLRKNHVKLLEMERKLGEKNLD